MPDWGAAVNENVSGVDWITGNFSAVSGESFPENGTLSSVTLYGRRYGSGNYDFRVAVYEGGASAGDIDGASLIWDSDVLDGTLAPSTAGWFTISGASGSISSGARVWIVVKGQYSYYQYRCTNADRGDLTNAVRLQPFGNEEATAYPSTAGTGMTDHATNRTHKMYLTYTTAGGVVIPPRSLNVHQAVARAANF